MKVWMVEKDVVKMAGEDYKKTSKMAC